jgi:hypothetical protein
MAIYGSNFGYGLSPYYKDDGGGVLITVKCIAFWYNIDSGPGSSTVIGSLTQADNVLELDGTSKLLTIYKDFFTTASIGLPASPGWHFVLIQYDANSLTTFVSFDLGGNQVWMSQPDIDDYWGHLLGTGCCFLPAGVQPIFDLRVYKPSVIFDDSSFRYYYDDVLTGGRRTIQQAL